MKQENIIINCPICRTENNIIIENDKIIPTIESTCIICFDNNANILMPVCKHSNFCDKCCIGISQKKSHNYNIDNLQENIPSPSEMINIIMINNDWIYNFRYDGTMNNIINNAREIFNKINKNNIFLCTYSGMGCYSFARRKNYDDDIETFFMHSDAWGQYGFQSSNIEEMNNFIIGYDIVKANEYN
jgi:hypothetical protein